MLVSKNMGRKMKGYVLIVDGGILKMWESDTTEKQKHQKITCRGIKEKHKEQDLCSPFTKGCSHVL